MTIKVLKDTPFNKAGDEITISEFRLRYSYIVPDITPDFTNKDMLMYLSTIEAYANYASQEGPWQWFKIIGTTYILPLTFVHEGLLYSMQFDGAYHKFIVGVEIKPENSLGFIQVPEAQRIFRSAKYRTSVMHTTNNINKKL